MGGSKHLGSASLVDHGGEDNVREHKGAGKLEQENLDRVRGRGGARSDEGGVQVRGGQGEAQEGGATDGAGELRRHVQHKPLLAQPAAPGVESPNSGPTYPPSSPHHLPTARCSPRWGLRAGLSSTRARNLPDACEPAASPASHEERSGQGRVEVAPRNPRGHVDQNSQEQAVADGCSGQTRAHGVGIAAATEEAEEEYTEKLGQYATGLNRICQTATRARTHTLSTGMARGPVSVCAAGPAHWQALPPGGCPPDTTDSWFINPPRIAVPRAARPVRRACPHRAPWSPERAARARPPAAGPRSRPAGRPPVCETRGRSPRCGRPLPLPAPGARQPLPSSLCRRPAAAQRRRPAPGSRLPLPRPTPVPEPVASRRPRGSARLPAVRAVRRPAPPATGPGVPCVAAGPAVCWRVPRSHQKETRCARHVRSGRLRPHRTLPALARRPRARVLPIILRRESIVASDARLFSFRPH